MGALEVDVVLIDIQLGEEDGVALAREPAVRAAAACIVLISSHDVDDVEELIAGSGAAGFLPKTALGAAALDALVRYSNFGFFAANIPEYELRLAIRPGVTGWAQTRYLYANNLAQETEKVRYDLYYIKHVDLARFPDPVRHHQDRPPGQPPART